MDGSSSRAHCWGLRPAWQSSGSPKLSVAKHAMPRARHAADRRVRTSEGSRLSLASSATLQRATRMIRPARVPELGGAVIDTAARPWQATIRAAQTPAFAVVMMAGLAFAGFGGAIPPLFTQSLTPHPAHSVTPHPAHSPTPHPAHRSTPLGPATTGPQPGGRTYLAPPLAGTKVENPRGPGPDSPSKSHDEATKDTPDPNPPGANPDLDAALNELDRQADRDEAWASQHPAPPPAPGCSPICANPAAPAPQQGPVPAGR